MKDKIQYPFTCFNELNVPINVNKKSKKNSGNLEYSLDFFSSYSEEWRRFKETFFGGELRRVLNDFTAAVDTKLIKVLNGEEKLNNVIFSFESNGGLKKQRNAYRSGNPKRERGSNAPRYYKKLN